MGILLFQVGAWFWLALIQYFAPGYLMAAAGVAAVTAFFDIRKKELLYFQLGSIAVAMLVVTAYIPE